MTKQQLIEDNMNLVYSLVSREYPTYIQDEDIIQCGMLGLCKAAEKWEEGKSVFSTFAWRCIRNEILDEFRRRAKHQGMLSLDYEVESDDGGRTTFGDLVVGDEDVGYIDLDINVKSLTPREQKVYELLQTDMTWTEIGEQLGLSKSTVWRIIRKLRALRG